MAIISLGRFLIIRKLLKSLKSIYCGVAGKTKKNTFFKKRTGEVTENKGSATKNEPERTGKRSGEVVENT
jgi:hypothetical protein